jgi:uncharacterized protein
MISFAWFMSHQPVIDGFEFASAGAAQEGRLPLTAFPRLRDVLVSDTGEIEYRLRGLRDERGRPSLRLNVRGTLPLRCQRCLERLSLEVDADALLVLAESQAEIDAESGNAEAPDRVLGSKEMAVRDLVEDELLLALPYAPRHDECEAPEGGEVVTASPFAVLRGMIERKH